MLGISSSTNNEARYLAFLLILEGEKRIIEKMAMFIGLFYLKQGDGEKG